MIFFWTPSHLSAATKGQWHGAPAAAASGVCIDSRAVREGQCFVALQGEHVDGHSYLAKAQQAGAGCALVSRLPANAPAALPLLLVENTEQALQEMARYRRQQAQGETRFIGITGSVGKTSAKEMLALALSAYGSVHATAGNYNNHLGLPITLCNLPAETDFCILEMGMNHAGEIAFLSHIAQPEIGLITTIDAVHLENFASVEGIAHAKAEIFAGMAANSVAVLPTENAYYPLLQAAAAPRKVLEFSTPNAPLIPAISEPHWQLLATAVLQCIHALGLPTAPALQKLQFYTPVSGRGAMVKLPWQQGEITLIDDAYNASPISMQAAIKRLAGMHAKGRKIAILGDMLELGKTTPEFHCALAAPLLEGRIDGVITVGALMQHLASALPATLHLAHYEDATAAIASLPALLQAGDCLLLKGSHGSGVHRLVDALKTTLA